MWLPRISTNKPPFIVQVTKGDLVINYFQVFLLEIYQFFQQYSEASVLGVELD